MNKNDAEKVAYEAARSEILLRIRIRDQILMFYLAVIGTILGITFSKNVSHEVLLIIPFIGLAVSFLFSQHLISIAGLAHFCRAELSSAFGKVPHWDNSETLRLSSKKQLKLRSYASILIILTPCLFSLIINFSHSYNSNYPYGPLWWFSALCFVISTVDIWSSYCHRKMIYNINDWHLKNISSNK